jgi:hypothetical protein
MLRLFEKKVLKRVLGFVKECIRTLKTFEIRCSFGAEDSGLLGRYAVSNGRIVIEVSEAAQSSKTSVLMYWWTLRDTPEDLNRHQQCCDNLKYRDVLRHLQFIPIYIKTVRDAGHVARRE